MNLPKYRDIFAGLRLVAGKSPRTFSTAPNILQQQTPPVETAPLAEGVNNQKKGWLNKLFYVRKIEASKESHSHSLSHDHTIYRLEFHDIKPECVDAYIKISEEQLPRIHEADNLPTELVGSWKSVYGCQDSVMHIWAHREGYKDVAEFDKQLANDKKFLLFDRERAKMLTNRRNELSMAFSYMGHPYKKSKNKIYELRTYLLKPGTLLEWGNEWARGITFRRDYDEDVAGFFSQIGDLFKVHHLWAYTDLVQRKEARDNAWTHPGWDQTVLNTVPLIKSMESRIMVPINT